jgi:hypothetical protein
LRKKFHGTILNELHGLKAHTLHYILIYKTPENIQFLSKFSNIQNPNHKKQPTNSVINRQPIRTTFNNFGSSTQIQKTPHPQKNDRLFWLQKIPSAVWHYHPQWSLSAFPSSLLRLQSSIWEFFDAI